MSAIDVWPNPSNSRIDEHSNSPVTETHFLRHEVMVLNLSINAAVYNREDTVSQAILSVAAQSYSEVEHLIIDGASNDGTLDAVQRLARHEMRVITEPDRGICDALNKGIRGATGEVVGLVHSDDFFAHDRVLENVAKAFERTGADAVYGDLEYVSAADTSKIIPHWRSGEFAPQRLGLYNSDYRIAARLRGDPGLVRQGGGATSPMSQKCL